jgi:PBP1b-binding outer membrane lipoprotein LpoB
MKKIVMIIFASMLVLSCSNGDVEKKAAAEEVAKIEMVNAEINDLDSIAEVLEQTAEDIETTNEELNNLLNEL